MTRATRPASRGSRACVLYSRAFMSSAILLSRPSTVAPF
jgi:hypothetical protein